MGETIETGRDDTRPARRARHQFSRTDTSVRCEDKPFRFALRRAETQVPRSGRGIS